jgi:hypothetical protein
VRSCMLVTSYPPSVSFTVTSFQKRFFSICLGFDADADDERISTASFIISACRFFLATLSEASVGCTVGVPGGGPGTDRCGRGVAHRRAEVCRHW